MSYQKNYPELGNIPLHTSLTPGFAATGQNNLLGGLIRATRSGPNGENSEDISFVEPYSLINQSASAPNLKSLSSTVAHELDHGIQLISGLQNGGNQDASYDATGMSKYERHKRYLSYPGETLASMQEARQNMTPEQRWQEPPLRTLEKLGREPAFKGLVDYFAEVYKMPQPQLISILNELMK